MKPGPGDRKISVLITGEALRQLQRHTYMMAESFGLDSRIDRYKGKCPIDLYQWDLDCLLDVIDGALTDREEYPSQDSPEYTALKNLYDNLRVKYEEEYGD